MSEKKNILIQILILIIIIAVLVFICIWGIESLGVFSVSQISAKAEKLGSSNLNFETLDQQYKNSIIERDMAQDEFNKQKSKYEAISDDTIELIKDVTKEQEYMIEYLWVVLGAYAEDCGLKLIVMEPNQRATFNITSGTVQLQEAKAEGKEETTVTMPNGQAVDSSGEVKHGSGNIVINPTTNAKTTKILLIGEYQDVADFVFEVENDKALKFKLDNISMEYAGENSVLAQFDVLDMSILLK